jgi:DNA-binding transcriptional regulator LsrR (DeoR family)
MAACKHESLVPLVRELYTQGNTKHQIAEMMGIRTTAVNYILYGVLEVQTNNPRGNLVNEMPREIVNRVITLSCWGYSKKEIAEDLEIKFKLVADLVKEATDKKLIQKLL